MKSLIVALASVALAAAAPRPQPGGTVGYGGVVQKSANFDPDRDLDYMNHARNAGKMAWSRKIFEDEAVQEAARGERETAGYVPTFFTDPQNKAQLLAAKPVAQPAQPQAQAQAAVQYQQPISAEPLYYAQYRQ